MKFMNKFKTFKMIYFIDLQKFICEKHIITITHSVKIINYSNAVILFRLEFV